MRRLAPGLLAAAFLAALAWGVHAVLSAVPWLTAALVLGVAAGSIPALRARLDGALRPGVALAAKRLLRLGIVLLGLQVSLVDIAGLGWPVVLAIVALVALAFLATWGIARLLGLGREESVLLASGFAICGVSAIGAMSAARRSSEQDAAAPTALVTLYGSLAILVLPLLSPLLGLDAHGFGVWAGASVHDVGQVVATAGSAGAAALAVGVVVKLTRVLLLAPMVAGASIGTRRRLARAGGEADGSPRPPVVPLFIVGFAALVVLGTLVEVPEPVLAVAGGLQSALLATALAAIGASLRLDRLVRSGGRALAAGALAWLAILGLALGVVALAA
ncbi:YeiH family protein [Homoserinibacter sp. YIM 151385]|uniref:YeiH family protein n=1 Tax=Homoserinibacter sp. YIM 151385 TaxID=2985506 RepID=UPI0022F0F271|nr:putative sulfate exporter family transporter [Homoserinibacter sp. YIM 151385]WBU39267.1 putative sulfate exporter family transporter [Homoserinibacter sp. YIM 151385]